MRNLRIFSASASAVHLLELLNQLQRDYDKKVRFVVPEPDQLA